MTSPGPVDTAHAAGDEPLLDGRYRVGPLLGRGGMAAVHRADDVMLGRTVAVKLFDAVAGGIDDAQRRESEIALLASVTHAHLVTLYDAGTDVATGREYIAMELVDGVDLATELQSGPLAADDAARLLTDIGEALHVIHGRGIVHRDVKPANVLLDRTALPPRRWHAKLADFGIARLTDSSRVTSTGALVGTAAFLSPEQVRGEVPGPPSDVYALGLVVLEALTGTRAYPGDALESAAARLQRDPVVPDELGDEWVALLRSMTAREPAGRPSAAEVAQAGSALASSIAERADAVADPTGNPPAGGGADATEAQPLPTTAMASTTDATRTPATDDPIATRALPPIAGEPDAASRRPARGRRRRRQLRPFLWAGVAAAVVLVGVVSALVLTRPAPEATPAAPDLPAIEGDLGVHLEHLMDTVTP
ncbi:serine/threonine-protein kinase [Agromyces mangrovi Wang et al. 2018]|uniref:serine/threonine-protein kinase n=1 Tax=Agromyces mangrovi TaxID=1858653 RepID=UPI002573DC3C|nr:serine/threonine-protein kinase [Agromyces mangrovi]BDZ64439.1 serine/threonine protein kinase [Agromyces mangrovi]